MVIRVLVADDQAMVRAGLRMVLDDQADIEVVADVADGRSAVRTARALRPDVCLLDVRMPGLDGLAATRELAGPDVADPMAVVILTTFDLDEYLFGALRNGAVGFLLKDAGPELLLAGVRAAASGDSLISPASTARLIELALAHDHGRTPPQPVEELTNREESVLRCVASGHTNQEIADSHHVSLSTIKTHITNLMNKTGARNRVELAIWAFETGRRR